MKLDRTPLAARIASDIPYEAYVNLGIGAPTLVADHLDPNLDVLLHTENGMLGMGPAASGDQLDPDLINAGRIAITQTPGGQLFPPCRLIRHDARWPSRRMRSRRFSSFSDGRSFELAHRARDALPAVGGAMDLAIGAKQVWVMMDLLKKTGASKLVGACTYPLTGIGCVSRVYSDHGVFGVGRNGVVLLDGFGASAAELSKLTDLDIAEFALKGQP